MLPNVRKSVLDYFMFAVLDKKQRQDLVKYAFKHFQQKEEFVWGPTNILAAAVKEHEMTDETRIPVENKCEACEENKTQEEESSEMQEDEMMPSSSTCNTAEDPRRECDPKLIVSDPEENKSTAYEENITLEREPIRKQETGEMLSSNTTEDVIVVSEQKTQSSQSNLTEPQNDQDMIQVSTEKEDINVKQSDLKDQVQGNPIPDSDGEQTCNESDEMSHNRTESSNSAQDEEKNGYVENWTAQPEAGLIV